MSQANINIFIKDLTSIIGIIIYNLILGESNDRHNKI